MHRYTFDLTKEANFKNFNSTVIFSEQFSWYHLLFNFSQDCDDDDDDDDDNDDDDDDNNDDDDDDDDDETFI